MAKLLTLGPIGPAAASRHPYAYTYLKTSYFLVLGFFLSLALTFQIYISFLPWAI
jgi:hypothetical protein